MLLHNASNALLTNSITELVHFSCYFRTTIAAFMFFKNMMNNLKKTQHLRDYAGSLHAVRHNSLHALHHNNYYILFFLTFHTSKFVEWRCVHYRVRFPTFLSNLLGFFFIRYSFFCHSHSSQ